MIVLDASAALEWLLQTPSGLRVERFIRTRGTLHAPEILDLEVAQVLRRQTLAGLISVHRAEGALEDFRAMRLRRYRHVFLLHRIWQLRANLTAYDAAYVALAEALEATLVTRDQRIASAAGHSASVEVIQ